MPVTEQTSTVKITLFNENILQKNPFVIIKIVKTKCQNKVLLTEKLSPSSQKLLFILGNCIFFAIFAH